MRASTSASQACGSMSLSFAVTMRLYLVCCRRGSLHAASPRVSAAYGAELPKNKGYQEAFIREFDSLCAD